MIGDVPILILPLDHPLFHFAGLLDNLSPVGIRLMKGLVHLLHLGLDVIPGLFHFPDGVLHPGSLLGAQAFHEPVVLLLQGSYLILQPGLLFPYLIDRRRRFAGDLAHFPGSILNLLRKLDALLNLVVLHFAR
jgi:hypothetical protein